MVSQIQHAVVCPPDLPSLLEQFQIEPAERNVIAEVFSAIDQKHMARAVNYDATHRESIVQPSIRRLLALHKGNHKLRSPENISGNGYGAPMAVVQAVPGLIDQNKIGTFSHERSQSYPAT